MCKTPLFGRDTFQVEMFHFDKAGSFCGDDSRRKTKERLNTFLAEHTGKILDVQFTGDDALVIYEI